MKCFGVLLLFISQVLCAQQTLKVGVIPFRNDTELKQTFQSVGTWIKNSTGVNVEIQYVDKDELGYLLSKGHLDLGVFRPLAYLKAKDEFPELEISLTHFVNNKESYTGYILVNASNEINTLQDLRNKKFTFIKPSSTSGYFIPLGVLRERGIVADDFFSSIDFSYSHERSIEMLQKGETDGIAVSDEDIDENSATLLKSFKSIATFDVPNAAYVFSPGLDAQLKREVETALKDARRNPAARTVINNPLHITGWVNASDELYNPLRRYMGIDRVKPSVQVVFQLGEQAKLIFEKKGDLLDILKRRVISELRASGRFSTIDEKPSSQKELLVIELSQLEEGYFNYHVLWNEELVGDADIDEASIAGVLPPMIRYSVLSNVPVQTQLAYDGERWFIPYGLKDGINKDDYTFYVRTKDGMLNAAPSTVNELNLIFDAHPAFQESNQVSLTYSRLDLLSSENGGSSSSLVLPISTEFWQDDFWDKFGLLVSVALATLSGLVTWYLSTRKKRNFKKVLKDANELLEAYVQDNNKMKTSLIELKENATFMLEKGEITENQFLIVKQRLDEIEQQIRVQKSNN